MSAKWKTSSFGIERLNLGVVSATAGWDSIRGNGYTAKLSHGPTRSKFRDIDEAKAWAEEQLRGDLTAALAALGPPTP